MTEKKLNRRLVVFIIIINMFLFFLPGCSKSPDKLTGGSEIENPGMIQSLFAKDSVKNKSLFDSIPNLKQFYRPSN